MVSSVRHLKVMWQYHKVTFPNYSAPVISSIEITSYTWDNFLFYQTFIWMFYNTCLNCKQLLNTLYINLAKEILLMKMMKIRLTYMFRKHGWWRFLWQWDIHSCRVLSRSPVCIPQGEVFTMPPWLCGDVKFLTISRLYLSCRQWALYFIY